MKVNESAENYLEAIFMLKKKNGFVRSIDVAHELEFTKASVSVAMKSFREKGYIVIDGAGGISLTPSGLEIAEKVYERHNVIASALMALGVNKDTAFEDSCKIEHVIIDESFEKLKEFLNKQN
ncbi:MAG: metal-dependent transcriptional regulator [Clostridia bacterium]|nr:metal-dependent transcriptional regulator [Clostridia bacterium]